MVEFDIVSGLRADLLRLSSLLLSSPSMLSLLSGLSGAMVGARSCTEGVANDMVGTVINLVVC
jgi:hypothetical protein